MSYVSPHDRLSISQISTPSWSFEQDALHYAQAGINGIGVWRNKLDALGIPAALAAMDQHGLKCANLVMRTRCGRCLLQEIWCLPPY